LKSIPLSDNGGRIPGFGGTFPEVESGVSIMLIYLARYIQQALTHNKNMLD
jgi:hypothetical protein